jgi:hypothetical protein
LIEEIIGKFHDGSFPACGCVVSWFDNVAITVGFRIDCAPDAERLQQSERAGRDATGMQKRIAAM